ncbi:hypothetical protein N0K71_07310 [Dellaglioa algida]|uniref:Uncharacterized protein n=1 Tax=Dellaglioa algida DSM 15638 TaxID=1423719 RepID=A0A0R1HGB5_9LACO|nr:hypothetical protein [Dellaglioa algida]KRK45291.1 hypothetical protein FC66_GL000346 [Dellaglioa algida DSM 15638]MDK1733428.1 hypothetical protein [Dellaglioa algida]MDK1734949.1 hypothetical protein [Dellaglioa algida]
MTLRDRAGNEYEQVSNGSTSDDTMGCFLLVGAVIVGIILVILALPVVVIWKILIRGFLKDKNQKYNIIINSLNGFKRWTIMIWITIVYATPYIEGYLTSQYTRSYLNTRTSLYISLVAITLIAINAYMLKNKNLNPWTGTETVKYQSVTHAIGISEFILLGVFAVLIPFSLTAAAIISLIATIIGYYVIENFL